MFKTVKGSSRPWQRFLGSNPEVYSISELSVGKILTVHHHEIEEKFPLWWFWDEFWDFSKNFGKLAIKYKLGSRLCLLFTSKTQNIWCVAHYVICIKPFQKRIEDILLEFLTFLLYHLWIKQSPALSYSTELC